MDIPVMFGLAVCATLLAAWFSDDHVRQKLALLLLFAWASTNVAVECLGFYEAPLVIPSLDAVVAIIVAMVGYANKSRLSIAVFALYVFVGAAHIAAFVLHAQATYNYYATLNVAFALQLIIVGGSSAWMAVHRWTGHGGKRLGPHPARR